MGHPRFVRSIPAAPRSRCRVAGRERRLRAGLPRTRIISFVPTGYQQSAAFCWLCVFTVSGSETLADVRLRQLGLCTWLPLYMRRDPRPQRDRIRPIFHRYLFVQADLGATMWRGIYRTPGVVTVLGTHHERPARVPDAALALLWADCGPNGVIYPPAPAAAVAIPSGSSVRLTGGAFAGLVGICHLSSAERVRIMLQVLGRDVSMSVPRDRVEVA